jgi:hypothetical protein
MTESDKQSNLLQFRINYTNKKFYCTVRERESVCDKHSRKFNRVEIRDSDKHSSLYNVESITAVKSFIVQASGVVLSTRAQCYKT